MNVRKATEADLSQILAVYARARAFMSETGNASQWKNTYPPEETVLSDIRKGYLRLLEDEDGLQCVFAFLAEGDPVYDRIEGAWLNSLPHAAVHRVASAGKKKGILRECMRYCAALSPNLKIDTHEDNKIMQHQLEKEGFSFCGTVFLANGEKRIAYQRTLTADEPSGKG